MDRNEMQELLEAQGYKLVEDAWNECERLTFVHDQAADRQHLSRLGISLQGAGWKKSKTELPTFTHSASGEVVEVEPGGAETSGHFLHYMSRLPG